MRLSKTLLIMLFFVIASVAGGWWLATSSQRSGVPRLVLQETAKDSQETREERARTALAQAAENKPVIVERKIPEGFESAYETEIVEGIEVRKDRNCTVKVNYIAKPDGTTAKAYSCEPNDDPPLDIYSTYSIELLEEMSYHDAHAAFWLSRRILHEDLERGMNMAFRSTALSGESKPIYWAMSHFPIPFQRNGVVQVEGVTNQYVMSGVLKELGLNPSAHNNRRLRVLDLNDDDVDIQSLDNRIKDIVAEIHTIRSEVGVDLSPD